MDLKAAIRNHVPQVILIPFLLVIMFTSCQKNTDNETAQRIAINSPMDGEVLIEGAIYLISYSTIGVNFVNIELHKNGNLEYLIAENIKAEEGFRWGISQIIHDSSTYNIKITDANNHLIKGSTDEGFHILPAFEKSSFTDGRDGRIYSTVKIGDLWWMAENCRYETEGGTYYFDIDSLGEVYGRMYTLEAAKSSAPEGWHLPTDNEWKSLERVIGITEEELVLEGNRSDFAGNLLKTDGGAGFKALYGGYNNYCAGRYGHIYQEAHFWTSSATDDYKPIIRVIGVGQGGISRIGSKCHSGCSVRYVKNH